MAEHIRELFIHDYKGIHELKLQHLNSINILTGDNNSGKTSVLEVLSTVERPHREDCWAMCGYKRDIKGSGYYNKFYNMFPTDCDDMVISYEYEDADHKKNMIKLKAEIEQTQVLEGEMCRLNNLKIMNPKKTTGEMIDAKRMRLSIFFNEEKVNTFSVYDFQTAFSFIFQKGNYVKSVYISPYDHASDTLNIDSVLSDSTSYETLIHLLQEFDDSVLNVSALKNKNNSRY